VLRKLARPGDVSLTESLSYPGLIAQARLMRLQLIGVETDEQGMLPDDLERMAKTMSAKIMFCSPSLHNPTSSTMSVARRMDIAAVAKRCGLLVIEDCVHAAAQLNPLPALSTWLPDQSFLLSSFSKVVSPGLRVGFLEASPEWLGQIAGIMRADCWMVAPLLPEIATDWLASGMMEELIARQRRHIGERVNLAQHIFEGLNFQSHPEYPHVWVSLPDPWRAGHFSAALRNAGVQVRTSDHFAVGRTPAPHAVRVSLNASADFDQLEKALHIFKTVALQLPMADGALQ
jgi:DNA-binding transcriptional MocR family regulator